VAAIPTAAARPGARDAEQRDAYFLPYQSAVIRDKSGLIIIEKARQIGLSYAVSYRAVRLAGVQGARLDVWVMSRDDIQAQQFVLYCKRWSKVLDYAAADLGQVMIARDSKGDPITAHCIRFASGQAIYCLSSNPDAIVGKTGHVILDEFALHKDQRQLYAVAKPVTQWGGTLTIISTHRGVGTVFNQLVRDVKENGNRMGWSLHTITIQNAVEQGLVERINAATGRTDTREEWLSRQRAECIDEEAWLQEYCCVPSSDNDAWIEWELITAAEEPGVVKDFDYLTRCKNPLYLGWDIARKAHLSVLDVGELVGDVCFDRLRVELRDTKFSEQRACWLDRIMALPQVRRACIDATGIGAQLAEEGRDRWGHRVEPVVFSAHTKEDLALTLRRKFEDHRLRITSDPKLRSDLHGVKKQVTSAGNVRFAGAGEDSHCDRFWALALRTHAYAARTITPGVSVG